MKFLMSLVAGLVVAAAAASATQDYTLVCNSSRLVAAERHACRVQMTAADTEAKKAEIFKIYDQKIASLATSTIRR